MRKERNSHAPFPSDPLEPKFPHGFPAAACNTAPGFRHHNDTLAKKGHQGLPTVPRSVQLTDPNPKGLCELQVIPYLSSRLTALRPSHPSGAIKSAATVQGKQSACSTHHLVIESALSLRPCGACVKKGYSIDQCIDGCESCRKARMRCEGGKPCQRCRELDQECVEEQITTGTRSDVGPPVLVLRNRQKSERAKLACQNCRRDNKKVRR